MKNVSRETHSYLSTNEVSLVLGLSLGTVKRRIKDGTLPAVKIGHLWKVRREDLPKPGAK
ncbi:MAG TPA: helix-turn-helix domain-containing protein [Bryobacteraceae bacterium]|nr:helix-turn-helix domain-containing protein [Bryobacteraceae bacterium]